MFGLGFEVREVSESVTAGDGEAVVTERQRTLLEEAVDRSYDEVPRTCTLTDLAGAKSMASERLHRAESVVFEAFLEGD